MRLMKRSKRSWRTIVCPNDFKKNTQWLHFRDFWHQYWVGIVGFKAKAKEHLGLPEETNLTLKNSRSSWLYRQRTTILRSAQWNLHYPQSWFQRSDIVIQAGGDTGLVVKHIILPKRDNGRVCAATSGFGHELSVANYTESWGAIFSNPHAFIKFYLASLVTGNAGCLEIYLDE